VQSSLLKVEELSHQFGARKVLEALSFELHKGEIVGLLGANGSGKSTVLQILCGLLRPQSGQIRLNGVPVQAGSRALRSCLGAVFQTTSVDPRLSARENLRLQAELHRVPRKEAERRIQELLALTQLDQRAAEPVKAFSGGMRRKLDLARALLPEPMLLLLDEPTAGLDELAFRTLWEYIQTLRSRRTMTVLIATHRIEEATACDSLVMLHEGRALVQAPPLALIQQVSGDMLVLQSKQPQRVSEVLKQKFDLPSMTLGQEVRVEVAAGHAFIPKIVESLPPSELLSVTLHRPTLADVFTKLTGRTLERN